MGATYKDKSRTFRSTRFYYDVSRFNPEIEEYPNFRLYGV